MASPRSCATRRARSIALSCAAVPAIRAEGNTVAFYQTDNNSSSRLYFTAAQWNLSGGSSDNVSWHVRIDFTALGWSNVDKDWWTIPSGARHHFTARHQTGPHLRDHVLRLVLGVQHLDLRADPPHVRILLGGARQHSCGGGHARR